MPRRALARIAKSAALSVAMLLLASMPASATILKNLDFQTAGLFDPAGNPWQWDNYVPRGISGVSLGTPGLLPGTFTQAAHFDPQDDQGRPRSMAKLSKHTTADPGVKLTGPLDAAEGLERWYLWHEFLPNDFDIPASAPDNAPTVIQAWHNDSNENSCNPNVQLHFKRT